MRISDWSSDVCSSDLRVNDRGPFHGDRLINLSYVAAVKLGVHIKGTAPVEVVALDPGELANEPLQSTDPTADDALDPNAPVFLQVGSFADHDNARRVHRRRSEEHTSELQSLMRISYAVFCLKKK